MAENYITRAALKAALKVTITARDDDFDRAIAAASRAIDKACGRVFYEYDPSNDQTRYYTPKQTRLLVLPDDLNAITSLTLDTDGDGTFDTVLTVNTDYVREPENADANDEPWTRIRLHPNCAYGFPTSYPRSVEIVGRFGWVTVPDQIEQATLLLAGRFFKRIEALFGVTFGGPEAPGLRITRKDSDVLDLIEPYVRNFGIV